MHYDYVVTLKRDSAKKTDLVSFLLMLFSFLMFSYVVIRRGPTIYLSIATIIILCGLLISLSALRKKKDLRFRNWLFTVGLLWLGMPFLKWLLIPFIFFALMEAQAKFPLEIGFYAGGVVINSLFKKKISWAALHSVILKDGLLTLDCKDNTLIQKEVLEDDEPEADEDEFNGYCRSKLVNL